VALTALDGVKVGGRAGGRGAARELGRLLPPTWEEVDQAMADPVYDGIDLITVTFALVTAAAIVFLLAQVVPQLADLTMPPPLSGTR
jgi:hypothetical protein